MIQSDKILLETLVTEKISAATANLNKYTFRVTPESNQASIAYAVEKTFNVSVKKVNIINVRPKVKRNRMRRGSNGVKPGYKKAIVTVKSGQAIELI
jgi:large subunit ribosomal protein L23